MPQHDQPGTCRSRAGARILKVQDAPKGAKEMTTTTRTTRKWTWAAVGAALALMVAPLAVGLAPASATPEGKVMICHATSSIANPYTTPNVDKSSIDEFNNWDWNGHGDHSGPVLTASMVQGDHWGDIIPEFTYTFTKHDETITVKFPGYNWTPEGQAIYNNGCAPTWTPPKFYGQTHGYCAVVEGTTMKLDTATVEAEFKTQYGADAEMVATLKAITEGIIPPFDGVEDADFAGLNWTSDGQALFANGCVPKTEPTLYAGTAAYPKVSVCYGPDVIEVGPIASPYGTEAIYSTQADADAAAAAFVTANTEGARVSFMAAHPEYAPVPADRICIPPTEPEPATVVEPATVAVPAPATVPVPAKVTLPARIPAGEGPTVPTYVLALLVLGATALAASTVHLVRTTR